MQRLTAGQPDPRARAAADLGRRHRRRERQALPLAIANHTLMSASCSHALAANDSHALAANDSHALAANGQRGNVPCAPPTFEAIGSETLRLDPSK